MSNLKEVSKACKILSNYSKKKTKISILHCTTEYPAPYEDLNLNVLTTLKKKFDCDIGYSDHSLGIEVPIAAVTLGAKIIEKHLTLDRKMKGPDHKASLEPKEFKVMVHSIRNIEKSLGKFQKKISKSEKQNIKIARKSIVAKKFIKKGEVLTAHNITVKRPSIGLSPMKWFNVLGRKAKKNFYEDDFIEL